MSSLNTLSVDVLMQVSSFLQAEDIAYLWFAGDSRLNHLLRNGGVRSFALDNPLAFPRLVTHFNGLKTFHLRLPERLTKYQLYVPGTDLARMSRGLEELVLDFPTALANLIAASATSWPFPNLTSLTLSYNALVPIEFTSSSLLQSLPGTLLHLWLPETLPVPLEALLSLHCSLLSLKTRINSIQTPDETRFRDAKIFSELTILQLVRTNVAWPRVVPPSVTDYTWTPDNAIFDYDPTEDLGRLPRHLVSLDVRWWPSDIALVLPQLPINLKRLKFDLYAPRALNMTDAVLKGMPPHVSELRTPSALTDPNESVIWPKSLTSWPDYTLTTKMAGPVLPEGLKRLSIWSVADDDIFSSGVHNNVAKSLPPTLQELHLAFASAVTVGLSTNSWLKLRECSLTSLTLSFFPSFDPTVLPLLPATLTHLNLLAQSLIPSKAPWIWPSRLQELVFRNNNAPPFGPHFWDSFGQLPLQSLNISLYSLLGFPDSCAFLPRTLTSGEFADVAGHGTPVLEDSFFSLLPPKLLKLSLVGFVHTNLTPSCCVGLPRTLRWLHFGPNQSLPKLEFGATADRMSEMWKFIDKLPPFLSLGVEPKVPDFAEWHRKRREDDLDEECPELTDDPFNTVWRLNETPRRNKP